MLDTLAPALNTEQRLLGLKSLLSAMSKLNLVSEFQSRVYSEISPYV